MGNKLVTSVREAVLCIFLMYFSGCFLGGGNSKIFFHPDPWVNDPICILLSFPICIGRPDRVKIYADACNFDTLFAFFRCAHLVMGIRIDKYLLLFLES